MFAILFDQPMQPDENHPQRGSVRGYGTAAAGAKAVRRPMLIGDGCGDFPDAAISQKALQFLKKAQAGEVLYVRHRRIKRPGRFRLQTRWC